MNLRSLRGRRLGTGLAVTLLMGAVISIGAREHARAQGASFYDRNKIPGHYTLGLYADERGQTDEVTLGKDDETFDVFLGVTGDSTKVFSGMVFRLDLPPGLSMAGPIKWNAIEGLNQNDSVTGNGVQVSFATACQRTTGRNPLVLARISLRAAPDFREATIEPVGHRSFGLSVELCQPENAWPKPYADPVAVRVKRSVGFWDRLFGGR